MEKTRVLIIDDNESLIDMIKEYFKDNESISIALSANDGLEGLEKIGNCQGEYDVVLLDLLMPKKDGLYVLEQMKMLDINKPVIVATSYNSVNAINEVASYGVNYFILKPFDLPDLEKRIMSINNRNSKGKTIDLLQTSLNTTITRMLHDLGIPSHIKGYTYIREGICLVYEKPSMIGGITKELYPALASRFNTTTSRIERAIRHAIEVSWNRGDLDYMEELFGHSVDIDRAKPTNSEFIVTLADKLRIENHKVGN